MKKRVFATFVGLFAFVAASPAQAGTVSFTMGGWTASFPAPTTPPADAPWGTNGYPGDTVAFQAYTFDLDLVARAGGPPSRRRSTPYCGR
jgi:hypothetical protein